MLKTNPVKIVLINELSKLMMIMMRYNKIMTLFLSNLIQLLTIIGSIGIADNATD
jgi:hypothetical protein